MTLSQTSRFEGALVGSAAAERLAGCDGGHTAAALELARSLIERRGFDSRDQAVRLSGLAFPLVPIASLAPLPMYLMHDAARAKDLAAEVSQLVDSSRESADACRYLTGVFIGLLRGESKAAVLGDLYSPVYNYWLFRGPALSREVDAVARGVYQEREAGELNAGDRPVEILETALWAYHRATDFDDGAELAKGLGGSVAARAALYGQLAGATFGIEAVPWEGMNEPRQVAAELLGATGQGIRHFTSWDQMRA